MTVAVATFSWRHIGNLPFHNDWFDCIFKHQNFQYIYNPLEYYNVPCKLVNSSTARKLSSKKHFHLITFYVKEKGGYFLCLRCCLRCRHGTLANWGTPKGKSFSTDLKVMSLKHKPWTNGLPRPKAILDPASCLISMNTHMKKPFFPLNLQHKAFFLRIVYRPSRLYLEWF